MLGLFQFDEVQSGGNASIPASPSMAVPPLFSSLSAPVDESEDELDYWKPSDDQLLMQAVLQIKDLELVHKGTKFSYPFSLQQVRLCVRYSMETGCETSETPLSALSQSFGTA